MKENFRNPETGEETFLPHYRSLGGDRYEDKYGKQICSADGVVLEFIPRDRGFPSAVMSSKSERLVKTQNEMRSRAKKHSNSLEQKLLRRDRTREEVTNYTQKKKQ